MTVSDQLVVREFEDKTMIINLKNGEVTVVDEIGSCFWSSLVNDSKENVFEKIMQEYDIDFKTLEEDYRQFISKLKELEIIW